MTLIDRLLSVRFANPFRPRVTVVYSSIWLHGTYAVHGRAGEPFMDLIVDQIVDLLPGEPTIRDIRAVRSNPGVTIQEVL